MIKVGIIGATGYAGGELVRLLMNHREAEIVWYGSKSYIDKKYSEVYQNMFRIVEDVCKDDNLSELAEQVDVIFTATPQGFLAGSAQPPDFLTPPPGCCLKKRFYLFLLQSQIYREEGQRKTFCLLSHLIHSPSGCNGWS